MLESLLLSKWTYKGPAGVFVVLILVDLKLGTRD